MQARIMVTYMAAYDMKTDDGRRSGVSVQYMFFGDHGEELQPREVNPGDVNGWRTAKDSIDAEMVKDFVLVPGIYDADFQMRVGSDGRPVQRLKSVKYVGFPSIKLTTAKAGAAATEDEKK